MSLHFPYTSVHALERSLVHASVFRHPVCASLYMRSSLLRIQHSITGIIIPSVTKKEGRKEGRKEVLCSSKETLEMKNKRGDDTMTVDDK